MPFQGLFSSSQAGRVRNTTLRKNRKGAFWEDRYHATAVQSGEHFVKCLAYIDLNMVRAGAVNHPSEWQWSGYNEIQHPRERYGLVDRKELILIFDVFDDVGLVKYHKDLVNEELEKDECQRESRWTESIAVGSDAFIKQTKEELGIRAKGRKVERSDDICELREAGRLYDFGVKKAVLSPPNMYLWDNIDGISGSSGQKKNTVSFFLRSRCT